MEYTKGLRELKRQDEAVRRAREREKEYKRKLLEDAASDLYEACKKLDVIFKHSTNTQWRDCYADQCVSAMEAAIAKAEGK